MNSKIWLTIVVTFFSSLVSDLVLLWSQGGVVKLSDVNEVAYAVAIFTALGAAIAVLKATLTDSPENVKQTNEIVSAAANLKEAGFANIRMMMFLSTFCAVFFVACASLTPNKSIDAASVVIQDLAIQVDAAQKVGNITNEQEDKFLDQLKEINGNLRLAVSLTGDAKTQSLEDINRRLTELRIQLAKEKK